jgi:hypothetical protein
MLRDLDRNHAKDQRIVVGRAGFFYRIPGAPELHDDDGGGMPLDRCQS